MKPGCLCSNISLLSPKVKAMEMKWIGWTRTRRNSEFGNAWSKTQRFLRSVLWCCGQACASAAREPDWSTDKGDQTGEKEDVWSYETRAGEAEQSREANNNFKASEGPASLSQLCSMFRSLLVSSTAGHALLTRPYVPLRPTDQALLLFTAVYKNPSLYLTVTSK